MDVQHKKRGRPRLRDERSHSFEVSHMQRPSIVSPLTSPTAITTPYRTAAPNRILKSQGDPSRHHSTRRPSLTAREDTLTTQSHVTGYYSHRLSRQAKTGLPSDSNAIAYLTTDFVVARSTPSLREMLGYAIHDLDAKRQLSDIVLETDREKVSNLYRLIQQDNPERDHNFLLPPGIISGIQSLREEEIVAASQMFPSHSETFHVQRPDSTYLRIRVRANLAKTSSFYFIVVAFSYANEMPPPLQLTNSAVSGTASYPGSATQPRIQTPTPLVQQRSPTWMTTPQHIHHHQYHAEPAGTRSPYIHGHPQMTLPSPVESRPRTMQTDTAFPSLAQYAKLTPSPRTATFHPSLRNSPPRLTPTAPSFPVSAALEQSDLQLPPLQLKELPGMGGGEQRPGMVESPETPRRERIGVKEMLD